jgi:hypothetical protein
MRYRKPASMVKPLGVGAQFRKVKRLCKWTCVGRQSFLFYCTAAGRFSPTLLDPTRVRRTW